MDRIGKFVVALAIVALVFWTIFNQKEMNKIAAARQAAAAEEQAKKAAEQPPAVEASATAAAPSAPAPALPPPVEEKTEKLTSPVLELTFSNLGGGISKAVLVKHEAEQGKPMVINEFG